ncbi:hypothetical protein [Nocardioides lianchengensis]|uniref:Uncharacterized protein n=1 Tax=Nocardioides lianchengensis TaxID=1045774 RepID=A0A1G6W1M2_9ACTN|nr:hypothetical protein [Nocardioides lianchengensis]NYG11352.1 hypothetical protein [Nocardioides lianchengensis]SDD58935.1 hypothetical protein SAMN05421872_109109 [Nocardioides lianchengensis]
MRRVRDLVVLVVRLELQMYGGLLRLVRRRPDVPPGTTPVRYVGAVAALLWGITIVSAVELVVLHLIIPWHAVRLAADVVGIWGLAWCLGMTACHYVYPHLLDDAGLRLRTAKRTPAVEVPWSQVAAVVVAEKGRESSRSLQVEDGVLHVVVGSRTNVTLRLAAPLVVEVRGASYGVGEVRFFADEPREVVAAIRERVS